jgi:hypothetical protein
MHDLIPYGLLSEALPPRDLETVRAARRQALADIREGFGKVDPRDPDYSKQGIFVDHNCWKCQDGKLPCPQGRSLNCEYPHARND